MKYFKILFVTFFFLMSNLYAQNLSITYNATKNASDEILALSSEYNLYINGTTSAYYSNNDDSKPYQDQSFIINTDQIGEFKEVNIADNYTAYLVQYLFYKDYKENTLIYNALIGTKKVIIKEDINLIDWTIHSDSKKNILEYECIKATGTFRGREYEAYFAPELSQRGGPWKFDGLPGVILSVKSLDGYYTIEPLEIAKNSTENSEISNVYNDEKIISWDTYKIDFKKWMVKQLKKLKSRSSAGENGSIEITDRIEDLGIGKLSF
ncbi:GLPGLI family protein [Psychroserpens sp. NJDZ02]|uniref:GLPGLI family protein n=1 Tax=Psychroserpens sp. NJDZ02 TaxID=2570561 RepID=UPI0010A7DD5C|nr:GLPGLI family protein [Psychroserpens sp. NJDZ02]QCE41008.1 GLPGLI family protein [Psychroserpens sp. NJDZ02]